MFEPPNHVAAQERDRVEQVVADLVSTQLACYWLSSWRSASFGPDRPLTRLTADRRSALVSDALDRDPDGYLRGIYLLGCDADAEAITANPSALKSSLTAFATDEAGPIRFVISQVGDSKDEHVFVPHNPDGRVQDLLQRLGLDAAGVDRVLPYERLRTIRLEMLIDHPICRFAFST
jgi:hypothetical protein